LGPVAPWSHPYVGPLGSAGSSPAGLPARGVLPPWGPLGWDSRRLRLYFPQSPSFGGAVLSASRYCNSCVQHRPNVTDLTLDLSIIATNLSTRQIADCDVTLAKEVNRGVLFRTVDWICTGFPPGPPVGPLFNRNSARSTHVHPACLATPKSVENTPGSASKRQGLQRRCL